ncbi:MAG: CocE/NonD family hydrolase, partial [Proteobacteria bacterium]|nr:CocE/NonD family hydrolase [Pseudomonadota bacterium]
DGYTNAVGRLLAGLECPRKGLIGPWAHNWPHDAVPEPSIGFLQEAVRWWDHWLKGIDSGIMDEPMLRVWMQDSLPPRSSYEERPGRWIAEAAWPSPRIADRRLHLQLGRLTAQPGRPGRLSITSPQTTGLLGGEWCAFGAEGELPGDQRVDDGRSLTFDSDALEEDLEILGGPVVRLRIAADRPCAMVAVRLNEVLPCGAATRITYGLLNLAHRDGHAAPEALEPGREYDVVVRLKDIAHRFAAGSWIRLAISTAYWPIAWPSPEPVLLTVATGPGCLDLPVRPADAGDAALAPFGPALSAPRDDIHHLRPHPVQRSVEIDLARNEMVYTWRSGGDLGDAALARMPAINLDIGSSFLKRYRIGEDDPLTARTELVMRTTMRRDDWHIRVEVRTYLTATATDFLFKGDIEAFKGDHQVAHRHWDQRIPRDLL